MELKKMQPHCVDNTPSDFSQLGFREIRPEFAVISMDMENGIHLNLNAFLQPTWTARVVRDRAFRGQGSGVQGRSGESFKPNSPIGAALRRR